MPLLHGRRQILGYRIGPFAYLTDCSEIPDEAWPLLEGVDLLVVDALRDKPHPTHFSVARGARGGRAPEALARVVHAHRARSAARGDVRATARGRANWHMMA